MANSIFIKYFSGDKNAGDLASPYLLEKISGQKPTPIIMQQGSSQQHYMGVGSTLRHADENTVVWGTGIMTPFMQPRAAPLKFLGVRGPLTRTRLAELGYKDVPVIGDGALTMRQFYNPPATQTYDFGLIPHYVDEQEPFCDDVRQRGGSVFSPQQDLEPYLDQLLQCRVILSSSLHGLIFAHAYGVPSIWVPLSNRVVGEGFKFRDYYAFMGVDQHDIPVWDPQSDFASNLAKATCPDIPDISRHAPELLYSDLKARDHV